MTGWTGNTPPQAGIGKDALEKARIRQRAECHERCDPPKHPLEQAAASPAAAVDAEAYSTGACAHLHEQEQARKQRQQARTTRGILMFTRQQADAMQREVCHTKCQGAKSEAWGGRWPVLFCTQSTLPHLMVEH